MSEETIRFWKHQNNPAYIPQVSDWSAEDGHYMEQKEQ